MKRATTRPADGEMMTLHEVANYLNCHWFTVYRLVRRGALPAFRLGSNYRVRRTDLEKWIADRRVVPAGGRRPRIIKGFRGA